MASFWEQLKKFVGELLAAFLIFVLLVFVAGELYALYFVNVDNSLMLWLPVALLLIVLAYKVID